MSWLLASVIGVLLPALWVVIKQIYLHPLSQYPGPKLWAVSRIPYVRAMWTGKLAHRIRAFHDQYGPVVRLAPDELSFTSPSACRDILGRRADGKSFMKNPFWVPPASPSRPMHIINAPDQEHTRIRRAWSYGFSDQSLKDQEPLIVHEVDKLMDKFYNMAQMQMPTVDLGEWFDYCIFDITGSLAFGTSYGCLDSANYHESLHLAVYSVKASVLMAACRYLPGLSNILMWSIAKPAQMKQKQHVSYSQSKVRERLRNPTERRDLLYHLQKTSRGLSDKEVEANAGIIISASSHTVNTSLLGITNFLLRYPKTLNRLTKEVRGAFQSSSKITLSGLSRLPYLTAVIEEGLRIVSPIPLGTPRVVPMSGAAVCGKWVPGGTQVAYMQWGASLSPENFRQPEEYLPERWLDPDVYPEAIPFQADRREALQPFNLGPRDCIGRRLAYFQLRLILAKLVFNFDLSLPEGPGSGLKWEEQDTYVIWSKSPFLVQLKPVK